MRRAEPFSWDERPDEAPIPVSLFSAVGGPKTETKGSGEVDPSEVVVPQDRLSGESHREGLAAPMPVLSPERNQNPSSSSPAGETKVRSRVTTLRRPAVGMALVAACVFSFAHGWHQGSLATQPQGVDQSPAINESSKVCEHTDCDPNKRTPRPVGGAP